LPPPLRRQNLLGVQADRLRHKELFSGKSELRRIYMTKSSNRPMQTPSGNLEPTRQSLLFRLKDWEDHASWSDFFNTYWRLIYSTARRTGLNDAEAQDAVQDTILAVAKAIKEFQYNRERCTFKSWLMLLTRQRIAMQFRKRQKHIASPPPTSGEATSRLDRIPDTSSAKLESLWEEEWKKNLFSAALERIKSQVKAKQFQMFELYALHHWPVKDVAAALHVSVVQVYKAKHRLSRLLKQAVQDIEAHSVMGRG
jgi:RNA polymerase sigma-70 factor (ECF subfamily)